MRHGLVHLSKANYNANYNAYKHNAYKKTRADLTNSETSTDKALLNQYARSAL